MVPTYQLLLLLIIGWLTWFGYRANTCWLKIGAITPQKREKSPTSGAYKSKHKPNRLYIIAGGSGFIGSWIVRYLLLRREEKIIILDRQRPPPDIMRPQVHYVEIDLTRGGSVDREMSKIRAQTMDRVQVIVYNCSLVKRYDLQNFQADLGVASAEFLYVSLQAFEHKQVIVIHVGDSMAHRTPIRNWDRFWPSAPMWCQTADADTKPTELVSRDDSEENKRDRTFSSYSWHQLHVEAMTLKLPTLLQSVSATAVLRVEGICSGHTDDGFFSPAIQAGSMFVHSPNSPLTVVHVEDVVRGCLSLEHHLADPHTRAKYKGQKFTVGSTEVTNLHQIARYVRQRRSNFRVWYIPSGLIFLITTIMSFIFMGRPVAQKSSNDSPLQMSLKKMTFSLFYTLQTGQVPNELNVKRQHDMLRLKNNFSLSETLDSIVTDVENLEIQAKKIQAKKSKE